MGDSTTDRVAASNRLTARWCAVADGDFVLSGAGLWPLLAVLAPAAHGAARAELAEVLGIPLDRACAAAGAVLAELEAADGISGALAVWFRDIEPNPAWSAELPAGVAGPLPDRTALDAWAKQHTGGLIPVFPVEIGPDVVLVLATALAANTTWSTPFRPTRLTPQRGRWAGCSLPGLVRDTPGTGSISVIDGPRPVTRAVVRGTGDLDVHLLVGDGTAGEVLATGLDALTGTYPVRTDPAPGAGAPGLTVVRARSPRPGDQERIVLPPFRLSDDHDLLANAAVFGLATASGPGSHFPGVADTALMVSQARQRIFAEFTAAGFSAAAVTVVAMPRGARPVEHEVVVRTVTADRPFSFLVVHRPSGTAMFAGHVAHPPADADGRVSGWDTRPS